MNDLQRIYVMTDKGCQTFLVYPIAGDEFISELVTERYGVQASGEGFPWEAHEVEKNKVKVAIA